jgi:membrane protein YqaA with SNARE-associated domain
MSKSAVRRSSPVRGLAAGLFLCVSLFPFARHLLFSTAGALLGGLVGVFIAVFVYAVVTTPRR